MDWEGATKQNHEQFAVQPPDHNEWLWIYIPQRFCFILFLIFRCKTHARWAGQQKQKLQNELQCQQRLTERPEGSRFDSFRLRRRLLTTLQILLQIHCVWALWFTSLLISAQLSFYTANNASRGSTKISGQLQGDSGIPHAIKRRFLHSIHRKFLLLRII